MFGSVDELLRFLSEEAIAIVDLWLTDPTGRWRHVSLPAASFNRRVADSGLGFDGSSVGFTRVESGDLALVPDATSAFRDPFHSASALGVICDVVEADTGAPFRLDPRSTARRAEDFLRATGLADQSRWGPELEFYVFRKVTVRNGPCICVAELEPLTCPERDLPPHGAQAYFAAPPADRLGHLRERICAELMAAGVPVKYHHHEAGRLGQAEIELPLDGLHRQADRVQIVKYFARMCARDAHVSLTFMPKPLHGEPGSGMHFHQHLFRGGKPLFFDPQGYAGLSRVALQYVAGLLTHGRSLAAFTNPSTNSFRRLVPGFQAPAKLFFSLANRAAAVRVPKYAARPEEKRIEFRTPDSTCNPYVAMAAMLMAGIDGVARELDPAALGFGPFDEDVFQWPPEKRASLQSLPRTLEEAVEALGADRAFLERDDVISAAFVDSWMQRTLENSCTEIAGRPHPYELELLYDC